MGKVLSYKEIKDFINGKEGNECKLLMTEEEFEQAKIDQNKNNIHVKLKILCGCCKKEIFYTDFEHFKRRNKKQCNICGSKIRSSKRKLSFVEVKNFIENESNSGCKLLSNDYNKNDEKLQLECKCGNIFDVKFRSFKYKNKRQCDECSKRNQKDKTKLSYEYVKNFIEVESNSGCELLSKYYENVDEYLDILCSCGEEFSTTFYMFENRNKRSCDKCTNKAKSIKMTKTQEQFEKEVYDLVGNEYTFLEPYINDGVKIKVRHNCDKCNNYEWEITPNSFLQGHGCPKCIGRDKTTEEFKQEVYNLVGDEYTVLGEYRGINKEILMRHNCDKCNNYEWETKPSNFIHVGRRCPKCNGGISISHDEFVNRVYKLVKNEYTVLGKYKNSQTKILMQHNICGNKYKVDPNKFMLGRRCPFCAESKGEQEVRHYLENNNIFFDVQYKFGDLLGVGENLLRFDFAIFDDEGKTKLRCLIEYDGEFHYEKQYDNDGFETLQIHDKLKNEYCIKNNIKLVRIPYWEFSNIVLILEKELKLNNKVLKEVI